MISIDLHYNIWKKKVYKSELTPTGVDSLFCQNKC